MQEFIKINIFSVSYYCTQPWELGRGVKESFTECQLSPHTQCPNLMKQPRWQYTIYYTLSLLYKYSLKKQGDKTQGWPGRMDDGYIFQTDIACSFTQALYFCKAWVCSFTHAHVLPSLTAPRFELWLCCKSSMFAQLTSFTVLCSHNPFTISLTLQTINRGGWKNSRELHVNHGRMHGQCRQVATCKVYGRVFSSKVAGSASKCWKKILYVRSA